MKSLSCELSQEELLEAGSQLASTIQDIAAEEDEQASVKSEMKARLTELEAKRTQLAIKVQRKQEWRTIEVQRELDFEEGMYREIRTDTGDVIFEREITDEERQEKLIIEDVDPSAEAKPAEKSA
jgi:hypothetical protein